MSNLVDTSNIIIPEFPNHLLNDYPEVIQPLPKYIMDKLNTSNVAIPSRVTVTRMSSGLSRGMTPTPT